MSKLFSKACTRNQDALLDILSELLPEDAEVFEVGSGTGQHAAHFAAAHPRWCWFPSDRDPEYMASVRAWRDERGLDNIADPQTFDVFGEVPEATYDAVFSANMIHVAPAEATPRLFDAAAQLLKAGGMLLLYGPFRYRDRPLEPSNAEFERWLQGRFEGGGLREFETLVDLASARNLTFARDVEMPANNHVLVFTRDEALGE